MDTPTISVKSYGNPLDSSMTSCGHPPRVSVPLIARILKKKVKNEVENDIFHNFHHAHQVSEGFSRHICQYKSSSDSLFNLKLANSFVEGKYIKLIRQ